MISHFVDEDPLPPIRAMVMKREDEMHHHVDIYRYLNTRFHVETWSWECVLTPLALAVEIAFFNFAKVLSVLVNGAGINPSEPYVIDDLTRGLHISTNALTHLLAQWDKARSDLRCTEVLHTLLRYGGCCEYVPRIAVEYCIQKSFRLRTAFFLAVGRGYF